VFTFEKIRVMISSRCNTEISYKGEIVNLSKIRFDLKKEIEAEKLLDEKELFDVSINEDAPAPGAGDDVWTESRKEVKRSHILIVLYTGSAGWARSDEEIGICHAELVAAMNTSPDKVRIIKLPDAEPKNEKEAERDERFRRYVDEHIPMWSTATTGEDAIRETKRALRQAVAEFVIRGSLQAKKGKFDYGAALDWSLLDFEGRQHQMIETIQDGLKWREGTIQDGDNLFVKIHDKFVLARCNGIPASMTIPAAREMVGQPFLHDYRIAHMLDENRVGPVHFIACNRSITEAQAMKQLGFPDATIVSTSFGVYVADNIQKIQLIFISNCRDETTTRYGVDEVFRWLGKSGEEERLAQRATARRRIIDAIWQENKI
jgi:hypothetical protein